MPEELLAYYPNLLTIKETKRKKFQWRGSNIHLLSHTQNSKQNGNSSRGKNYLVLKNETVDS
jgi:hypothetical protein